MRKLLPAIIIATVLLLSSCSIQTEFRIPQNLTPAMIASEPAELFDLITIEKVDEILESKVTEGVAAFYNNENKSAVVYVGFFSSTLKSRLFFEKIAIKNVFSVKKYSEAMNGGMMEIEKKSEKLCILWDRFFTVVIKGDKELAQKICEMYIDIFSLYN
ncbi:MAG: DUF3242 domain-containing protein [Thermotogaceae bacterium]|nr:DUF3242 domain-containing protein [Thermotogaceae bacterium]